MDVKNVKTYRIGLYQYKPDRNLLILNGEVKKLESLQAKILNILIDNKGAIVSRSQLEKAWQGSLISEQSMNNKISTLRKLFNDDCKQPLYIKTHHKLGYELVAKCLIYSPLQSKDKFTVHINQAINWLKVISFFKILRKNNNNKI